MSAPAQQAEIRAPLKRKKVTSQKFTAGLSAGGVRRNLRAEAAAFFALPSAGDALTFSALAFVVVLCFGGGLGTMPAFAADYFGPKHVGAIFGLILTASGLGSVLGPLLLASSLDATGGYGPALRLLGVLALGAWPSRCSSAHRPAVGLSPRPRWPEDRARTGGRRRPPVRAPWAGGWRR